MREPAARGDRRRVFEGDDTRCELDLDGVPGHVAEPLKRAHGVGREDARASPSPHPRHLDAGFLQKIKDLSLKGGSLYMVYQRQKETLAQLNQSGALSSLGLRGIP